MERIFKIQTKTSRDPRTQYPSERRYSASIVVGLSVVFFQLFLFSVLMGTLIIHKMTLHSTNGTNNTDEKIAVESENAQRLYKRVEQDLGPDLHIHYVLNLPVLVCVGCFIMSLGYLFSFATGLVSWKHWYIDHNITFFFLSTTLSTVTSSLSFLLALLPVFNMDYHYEEYKYEVIPQLSPLTFSLTLNIIILSCLGIIWSFLSTRIAYKGMRTNYPDDVAHSKHGNQVAVNNVTKGDMRCSMYPPDIISHFPVGDKLAKYLPKKETGNLPKAESNFEYQQRVNKFLSGKPESTEHQ